MDIYARLKKDHDTQRELGKKICATEGNSEERQALWKQYKIELEAHASAEEQTFYAELMTHPDASDKARHSVSEHKEAADLIEEIDDMDMSSPGWLTRFKQLQHDVEHHVDEEEDEVFEVARKVIDINTANELARAFNDRKPEEVKEEKNAA